jgi:hypothetical protein
VLKTAEYKLFSHPQLGFGGDIFFFVLKSVADSDIANGYFFGVVHAFYFSTVKHLNHRLVHRDMQFCAYYGDHRIITVTFESGSDIGH